MIIRNKKHLCRDKKLREAAGEMQPLLFFKEQTLLPLQLIFSHVLIYYYEKHLYNIRFTWVVQRKM